MLMLIIDDEASLTDALADALRDEGHEVLTAGTGEAALHLLAFLPVLPRLIILDLMLPGMSGVEVSAALQQSPRLAHIPVLIITAVSPTNTILQNCHAQHVLQKPFPLDILLEAVAGVNVAQ